LKASPDAKSTMIAIPNANAIPKPSIGEITININVFSTPAITIALLPPDINPKPMRPPINAWLLEDGAQVPSN
jgi:hypothetical protein